tara:strand:- start:35 stop:676 length:642 start_codon:yes stop_codon:yes gene_type:complete
LIYTFKFAFLKTFQKNIGPLIAFFLFFLIGLAFLAFYSKLDIQRYINSFYNAEANIIFLYLTRLAEGWLTVPLLIFLFFYNWRNALYIAISYGIASIFVAVLKRFVFSEFKRPHGFRDLLQDENYKWLLNVDMPSNLSFPSGHTTVAFCIFFGLALIIPNKKIGTALVLLAVLIGFSRTYLSYHFLMDLVAGSFLGVATALGMYFLLRKKLRL